MHAPAGPINTAEGQCLIYEQVLKALAAISVDPSPAITIEHVSIALLCSTLVWQQIISLSSGHASHPRLYASTLFRLVTEASLFGVGKTPVAAIRGLVHFEYLLIAARGTGELLMAVGNDENEGGVEEEEETEKSETEEAEEESNVQEEPVSPMGGLCCSVKLLTRVSPSS